MGVSRPTLVRLLTDGHIDYAMRGKHRRVRLTDLLDYQESTRAERHELLDTMTQEAEDEGLYDTEERFAHTR